MRRRRRQRHFWIFPGVVLTIVLGFAWTAYGALTAPARGEDGCPVNGAASIRAIAIDSSDPIAPPERAEIEALVRGCRAPVYLSA